MDREARRGEVCRGVQRARLGRVWRGVGAEEPDTGDQNVNENHLVDPDFDSMRFACFRSSACTLHSRAMHHLQRVSLEFFFVCEVGCITRCGMVSVGFVQALTCWSGDNPAPSASLLLRFSSGVSSRSHWTYAPVSFSGGWRQSLLLAFAGSGGGGDSDAGVRGRGGGSRPGKQVWREQRGWRSQALTIKTSMKSIFIIKEGFCQHAPCVLPEPCL